MLEMVNLDSALYSDKFPSKRLLKVEMPIAAPFIMFGIRISAVTAVGTMTIAAFAGAGGQDTEYSKE